MCTQVSSGGPRCARWVSQKGGAPQTHSTNSPWAKRRWPSTSASSNSLLLPKQHRGLGSSRGGWSVSSAPSPHPLPGQAKHRERGEGKKPCWSQTGPAPAQGPLGTRDLRTKEDRPQGSPKTGILLGEPEASSWPSELPACWPEPVGCCALCLGSSGRGAHPGGPTPCPSHTHSSPLFILTLELTKVWEEERAARSVPVMVAPSGPCRGGHPESLRTKPVSTPAWPRGCSLGRRPVRSQTWGSLVSSCQKPLGSR